MNRLCVLPSLAIRLHWDKEARDPCSNSTTITICNTMALRQATGATHSYCSSCCTTTTKQRNSRSLTFPRITSLFSPMQKARIWATSANTSSLRNRIPTSSYPCLAVKTPSTIRLSLQKSSWQSTPASSMRSKVCHRNQNYSWSVRFTTLLASSSKTNHTCSIPCTLSHLVSKNRNWQNGSTVRQTLNHCWLKLLWETMLSLIT